MYIHWSANEFNRLRRKTKKMFYVIYDTCTAYLRRLTYKIFFFFFLSIIKVTDLTRWQNEQTEKYVEQGTPPSKKRKNLEYKTQNNKF